MRRIICAMLLSVLVVGLARAQESTGAVATAVIKQIKRLEHDKVQAFLSTTTSHDYCADWIRVHDAEGIDHTMEDGSRQTKAQVIAELQTGNRKLSKNDQYNHVYHVYGNGGSGTTVVVSYDSDAVLQYYGKTIRGLGEGTDVWVNVNGKWWFVLNSVHPRASQDAAKKLAP